MVLLCVTRNLVFILLLKYCSCLSPSPGGTDSEPVRKKTFPSSFMFGSATSAIQTEGAWNSSGKSPSIWDVFGHKPGKIKDNSTADVACKSYDKYTCDSAMLRYLGVDAYRFSISWPRILPTGFANNISQEGIDHYNQVIDNLLLNAIEPIVTITHFDLPQCLQDLGGWVNSQVAEWLEDYARVLFENFGDRVKIWSTINEPRIVANGYGSDKRAPGLAHSHGIAEYMAAKNIILAHARVWHTYDKEFRKSQKGTSDFYGLNHYSTQFWSRSNYKPGSDIPSLEDDLGAKGSFLNYPRTASEHIAVIPHGIRRALKWVKDTYNNPPILITENGVATYEDLKDFKRIDYFKKYLSNVLDAIYEDQVNVIGYIAWSLMDNFELSEGYGPKFGLFKVDHEAENKRRQARLSAIWYRDLISSRTLDPNYTPKFETAEFCAT